MAIKVLFEEAEVMETKVHFKEVLPSEYAAPIIGEIDVPKSTLEKIKWKPGRPFEITVGKVSSTKREFVCVLRPPTFAELNDDFTDPN